MPAGANALVWRIALDPRVPDGFADIHASWDLDDVAHAITLIEQLDGVERRRAAARGVHG